MFLRLLSCEEQIEFSKVRYQILKFGFKAERDNAFYLGKKRGGGKYMQV